MSKNLRNIDSNVKDIYDLVGGLLENTNVPDEEFVRVNRNELRNIRTVLRFVSNEVAVLEEAENKKRLFRAGGKL